MKRNFKLIASITIMMVALLMRDVLMFSISELEIALISFLTMVILPYPQLITYVFFLLPLTCGIPGYSMLLAIMMLIIKGKTIYKKQLIPILIIATLEVVNDGLTGGDMYKIISFLSFVAVFFYLVNIGNMVAKDVSIAILCFSIGVVFVFFVVFYNMIALYGINEILLGIHRSGALGVIENDSDIMEGHIALNANSLAYYAICAGTSLLASLPFQEKKTFCYLLIATIVVLGLLSFSRTYIFCLLLFVVLYYITRSSYGRFEITIAMALLAFVMYFLFDGYTDTIYDVYNDRLEDANATTAGGRTWIFSIYNSRWISDIGYVIFGCGVVDYVKTLGMPKSMHCGLQQIWVCLGLIGFTVYFQVIASYLKKHITRQTLIYATPFIASLVFDQSIQFLNPYSLMLPIIAPLYVCKLNPLIK